MISLTIEPDGRVRFLYDDRLLPLLSEGDAVISRASHVEPEGCEWFADLSPVGGPKLGPFHTREQALREEADWLQAFRL